MESKPKITTSDRLSFQHLREKGHRIQATPWLLVYWNTNGLRKPRILWNLSRKIGNAVVRNRLKRWCREFIRNQLGDLLNSHGLDLNVAFRPIQKDFYKELRREQFVQELLRVEKKIRSRIGKDS